MSRYRIFILVTDVDNVFATQLKTIERNGQGANVPKGIKDQDAQPAKAMKDPKASSISNNRISKASDREGVPFGANVGQLKNDATSKILRDLLDQQNQGQDLRPFHVENDFWFLQCGNAR